MKIVIKCTSKQMAKEVISLAYEYNFRWNNDIKLGKDYKNGERRTFWGFTANEIYYILDDEKMNILFVSEAESYKDIIALNDSFKRMGVGLKLTGEEFINAMKG